MFLLFATYTLLFTTCHCAHRLDPSDGSIIHCAGQTNQDFSDGYGFQDYSNVFSNGSKPLTYMVYTGLSSVSVSWFNSLNNILINYDNHNQFVGVQLGLDFSGQCQQVASGQYDNQINSLIRGMQSTDRPYWLRIGYEFNGEWNNYNPPNTYILAFQRITKMIRNNSWANNYVATVWDYATDAQNLNYMQWYPGDSYVDWWGVNIFSGPSAPTSNLVTSFSRDAKSRGFPVLLGESTPRYTGVTQGQNSWNEWFQPYFYSLIFNSDNGIRGFCYINWNWATADNGQWSNWGDAEIEKNNIVENNYKSAINQCHCFNSADKQTVLKRLGLQ